MPVTRTGKQCPICKSTAGVEEFRGLCPACYHQYRIEEIKTRSWCHYCGQTRIIKIKGQRTCSNPKCGKLL